LFNSLFDAHDRNINILDNDAKEADLSETLIKYLLCTELKVELDRV
jgi:hypothetical protein